jgi:hypothetical protein
MEADIRDLNKLLLKEPFWKSARTADGQETSIQIIPGEYKKQGNSVLQPDGTIFHYAKPEEVPAKMMDLMTWYATDGQALHPLLRATEWHHRFILIHPFGDGNGRVARLMVNYILMHAGYMPLVVKSAEKGQYLTALKKADAGDMIPFAEYMASQEIWALELALRAANGGDLEERGDWVKEAQILYENAVTTKEQERLAVERKRALILETAKVNLPLLIEECTQLITAFAPFYNKVRSTVTYRVPFSAGLSIPLGTRQPMDKMSPEVLSNWLKDEILPLIVVFNIHFEGDRIRSGAIDTSLEFTWHFEENEQRFRCNYTPDPYKDRSVLDLLTSTKLFGEYRQYGISIALEPLDVFEEAGKWMLQQAKPSA